MGHSKLSKMLEQASEGNDYIRDILIALENTYIITITDNRGVIKFVNDKFCQISKYSAEELVGHTHNIINSGYHDQEFFKSLWRTIGTGKVWKGEIKNKAKDGSYYWVQTTIVPFLNEKNKPYQYISFRLDISDMKEVEELAYYDSLTSLPNRNYLNSYLAKVRNNTTYNYSILFLDLNGFKEVNDLYGHDVGDILLQEVSARLQLLIQSDDHLFRLGGDEFLIIAQDYTETGVAQLAQHITQEFRNPYKIKGTEFLVSTSIGISCYPDDGDKLDQLIKDADTAMYHAKNNGLNSYQFYKYID